MLDLDDANVNAFFMMTEVVAASSSASEVTLDNASCLIFNTSTDALVFSGLLKERLVNPLSARERAQNWGGEVTCVLIYVLFA